MTTRQLVYGRFDDAFRTYVVTSASVPDTIRVFAGDPRTAEMVCTISNVSERPYTSWNAKWYSNFPDWKDRFETTAVSLYRHNRHDQHRHYAARHPVFRACDG